MNFVRTIFLQLHSASIIGGIEECHYKCIISYSGFNTSVHKLNMILLSYSKWLDGLGFSCRLPLYNPVNILLISLQKTELRV